MAKNKIASDIPPEKRQVGRPKGAVNKTTALLKDAILKAAETAGDGEVAAYLAKQAIDNPGPFMALLGKVLPMQVGSDPDNPIIVEVRRIIVRPPGHSDS